MDFNLLCPVPRLFSDTKQKPYATGRGARNPSALLVLHKDKLYEVRLRTHSPYPLGMTLPKTACYWKRSWCPGLIADAKQGSAAYGREVGNFLTPVIVGQYKNVALPWEGRGEEQET